MSKNTSPFPYSFSYIFGGCYKIKKMKDIKRFTALYGYTPKTASSVSYIKMSKYISKEFARCLATLLVKGLL